MSHISRFGKNRHELRSARPLTDDQIRAVAPSIFATDKHVSRSERFTFIPTSDILSAMRREGFQPFMVAQSRSRIEGKEEFTKHMLRFRRESDINLAEAIEAILVNAHDGTSSYQLIHGAIRFACANGLVCASGEVTDIRIAHKGDIVSQVIEGAYTVISDGTRVRDSIDAMKGVTLSAEESEVFARAALTARYGDEEARRDEETGKVSPIPLLTHQVLTPRRIEDRGADLWRTFNRAQENLVQGGQRAAVLTESGRRNRTRAVTGINQNVNLNRALWQLAEEMKRIKAA